MLNIIIYIILCVILVQYSITKLYTNTKEFSIRALIRNLIVSISIYLSYNYKNNYILLIPILTEIILEVLKLNGYHIEKYISTKYQYNDYWRDINKKNNLFSNFSEANYDKILGLDTIDHSSANLEKILKWSKKTYDYSYKHHPKYLTDFNGNKHDGFELKKTSDNAKFKLICDICDIKPNMKILEIGFGECDFMEYIRKNYNISPIGVSISCEQVKLATNKGFKAYCMNAWDMTQEELGTYDLILQCGNLEYLRCTGESSTVYEKYSKIIYSLLNEKGRYFITCIHSNSKFKNKLYDNINAYFLWSGNDGKYPDGKNGFSKHAEKLGLKKIYQQERTIDYFIASIIFMSYFNCMDKKEINSTSLTGYYDALIKTIAGPYFLHTYICYSPNKYNFYYLPWLWEFIPQYINNEWITPVTLEYILFEKQ